MDRSEEREQARLIKWTHLPAVRKIAPDLAFLFHVPNGGRRDGLTGSQMTALGVKRGVPDLWLPIPSQTCSGLIIEMKSATGRTSPDQIRWIDRMERAGWLCEVCRSADEAREVLISYMGSTSLSSVPL